MGIKERLARLREKRELKSQIKAEKEARRLEARAESSENLRKKLERQEKAEKTIEKTTTLKRKAFARKVERYTGGLIKPGSKATSKAKKAKVPSPLRGIGGFGPTAISKFAEGKSKSKEQPDAFAGMFGRPKSKKPIIDLKL